MSASDANTPVPHPAILVVQSNRFLRAMICDCLQGAGYAPHPVGDESGMLEALQRQHIDLILLDLDLSRAERVSLLASVQSKLSRVPLVLLTGVINFDDVVSRICDEISCVRVEKPYSFSALCLVVEAALARSR